MLSICSVKRFHFHNFICLHLRDQLHVDASCVSRQMLVLLFFPVCYLLPRRQFPFSLECLLFVKRFSEQQHGIRRWKTLRMIHVGSRYSQSRKSQLSTSVLRLSPIAPLEKCHEWKCVPCHTLQARNIIVFLSLRSNVKSNSQRNSLASLLIKVLRTFCTSRKI